MPVCSYLVLPEPGGAPTLSRRLAALPGCDVTRSSNRNLLLLVTDTPSPEKDRELRSTLQNLEGIHALILTFGEIDPDTEEADPVGAGRKHRRAGRKSPGQTSSPARSQPPAHRLPVIQPGDLPALRRTARREGEASFPGDTAGASAPGTFPSSPDETDS